jgi:hypothetical protein
VCAQFSVRFFDVHLRALVHRPRPNKYEDDNDDGDDVGDDVGGDDDDGDDLKNLMVTNDCCSTSFF